jgi:hypothetical protein
MDLSRIAHVWRRRPLLTMATLSLAAAVIIGALLMIPRTYQSSASVMMLAPRSAARQTGGNPYLSFSPSLTLTASAVADELMAPQTGATLASRGLNSSFTAALAPYTTDTTGSVVLLTVAGTSKADVAATLQAVIQQVSATLSTLQHGVAPQSEITAVTLSYASQPTVSSSQTARSMIVIILPVILLALGIPIIIDGRAARRALRRGVPPASHVLRPAER